MVRHKVTTYNTHVHRHNTFTHHSTPPPPPTPCDFQVISSNPQNSTTPSLIPYHTWTDWDQRCASFLLLHLSTSKSEVSDALSSCSHVFIRHDAIKRSLQPPFTGPFPVIKRSPKYYTVTVNGRQQTVSSDRLKPAFFEGPESTLSCPSSPDTPPTQSTRSGRTVRFPDRLTYWYCRDWSPLSYVNDDL